MPQHPVSEARRMRGEHPDASAIEVAPQLALGSERVHDDLVDGRPISGRLEKGVTLRRAEPRDTHAADEASHPGLRERVPGRQRARRPDPRHQHEIDVLQLGAQQKLLDELRRLVRARATRGQPGRDRDEITRDGCRGNRRADRAVVVVVRVGDDQAEAVVDRR
ncbi:hypothetical protein ASG00_06565 [Microbacterium sp. Leaf351]|nr:hypothetical protein ASG00_06565 [Microbacterium sp. Leaf351]